MATASGSGPSPAEERCRPLGGDDLGWAATLADRELGGRFQARLGRLVDALDGSGLVAEDAAGRPIGLVTWLVEGEDSGPREGEVRILVVEPASRRHGVAGRLLTAAERAMDAAGAVRAWLVTTNDNVAALAFYQGRGWQLSRLLPGAVDEARRTLKPAIALVGENGLPIRDEIVLAKDLRRAAAGGLGDAATYT